MARIAITNSQGQTIYGDLVGSVPYDINGNPVTPTEELKPFLDRVALGQVDGVGSLFKFGANANVGVSETLLSDIAQIEYPFTKLGETFRVEAISDSADDNVSGSGCRKAEFVYLDAAGIEQKHEFTPTGLTGVDTGVDASFVYRAYAKRCGGSGKELKNAPAGNIKFRNKDITANEHAQISAGIGQTEMAIYRVPSNKVLLLTAGSFQVAANRNCTFLLKFRLNEHGLPAGEYNPIRLLFRVELSDSAGNILPVLTTPTLIPPDTDVFITGQMAAQTGAASASFGGRLYDLTPEIATYLSNL